MLNGKGRVRESGYTYIAMLVAVAAISVGLAATGIVWSQASQREKERELIFVGDQFRQAIERFYERSPGVRRYPKTFEELLSDTRFPNPERHLRKIYADPVTGKVDWVLMPAPGGGIMGVHSSSEAAPIKNAAFSVRDRGFEDAKSYKDWAFFYDAQPATAPAGASPAPTAQSSPTPATAIPAAAVLSSAPSAAAGATVPASSASSPASSTTSASALPPAAARR